MSEYGEDDEDLKIIQRHVDALREHFDTVQIFTTRHTGAETFQMVSGDGNWLARRGQIRDWTLRQDESVRKEVHDDY